MKHVLYFRSHGKPILAFREEGKVNEFLLAGEIKAKFSEYKRCIGFWGLNGIHSCVSGSENNEKQCPRCSALEIKCALCKGDYCLFPQLQERCAAEEHSVYLTSFGNETIKVGVTKTSRLLERWLEQGADFGVEVLRVRGGLFARRAEQLLQQKFLLTNLVRTKTKINMLNFDKKRALEHIKLTYEKINACEEFSEYLAHGKILDLSGYYPRISHARISNEINGKILGAKGNLLFYENVDTYVLNMSAQIGRFLI